MTKWSKKTKKNQKRGKSVLDNNNLVIQAIRENFY